LRIACSIGVGLAALALAACSRPPPPPSPKPQPDLAGEARRVEAAIGAIYAQSQASGMVVAVVHGDQARAMGFGRLDPKDARPADASTLVRLQSVSKLFAGELLADLASRGVVKLADPLASHAPARWRPARSANAPITLLSLATHTSGLPREAPIQPGQPAAGASAARWAWLARQRRLRPPGRGAAYSNVAFDLLGDALASAAKAPYGAALSAAITAPLGMADTAAAPSADECRRLMAGDPHRAPHPCVDQSGEAASGGLYSTAGDMALWLRAELAPGQERGRRSISQAVYVRREALAYAVGLDHAGPANGIGLAWIEQDAAQGRARLLEKTGGGDGFLAYVALDPVRRVGVFVAFNNVSGHRLGPVAAAADQLVFLLGAEPDAVVLPGAPALASERTAAAAH
jgi:D-alanyl-D-alanine-carboxypeptidase/D-alanyl-D-alanine-endopeptidase